MRPALFSLVLAATVTLSGVAAAQEPDPEPVAEPVAEPGAVPIDFPRQEVLNAVAGQLAVGIDPYRLKEMRERPEAMISYTNFEVIEPGAYESRVKRVGESVLPNALILPFPRDEKVAVGDVLFTWWQSGGGIAHAIVVGGTPRTPVVRYLTLPDSVGASKVEHTLGPESFIKLDEALEPGSNVMFPEGGKYAMGTVVQSAGDKLLVIYRAKLVVVEKSRADPIPAVPSLKKGKVVYVPKYGTMGPAKVLKIDKKLGRVTVELQFAGRDKMVVPYSQIANGLP